MTAKTVTIEEAQAHLQEILSLVEQGKEVIIAKGKEPLAKLTPLPKQDKDRASRVFGEYHGDIWVSDDFDTPLPDTFWLGSSKT